MLCRGMNDEHELAEMVARIVREEMASRPRLTKEDVREVVEKVVTDKFLMMGLTTKTQADIVRTQNAFGFLFRISRAANSAITKIIMVGIIAVIALGIMATDISKFFK